MLKINETPVRKLLVNNVRAHQLKVDNVVVFDDKYELIWKVEYIHINHARFGEDDVYITVTSAYRKDSASTKNLPVQVILYHNDEGAIYTETLNLTTPIQRRLIVAEYDDEVDYIYKIDLKINGSLIHSGNIGQNITYTDTYSFYENE